jgi:hypothetical protein
LHWFGNRAAGAPEAEKAKDEYRCKFIADRLVVSNGDSSSSDSDNESDDEDKVTFVPLEKFATVLLQHAYEVRSDCPSLSLLPPFTTLGDESNPVLAYALVQVTEYSRKWMEEHPTARMPDARHASSTH